MAVTYQDVAPSYEDPNVGYAQGVPEHEQIILPVCSVFPAYILNWNSCCREAKETAFSALVLRVLYQTPSRSPFSIHWLNRALASQRQSVSDESLAVICITPIHMLIWFVWNQAPPVDIRWLSRLKFQRCLVLILVRISLSLLTAAILTVLTPGRYK